MPAVSFYLPDKQSIYERKVLLLKEFGWYPDDNVPLQEFFYLSDVALIRREKRIKAARNNKELID